MAWDKWEADWIFNNVFDRNNGSSGKSVVYAEDKRSAEEKIRNKASKQVFGTTMMQRYFRISNLKKVE